MYIDITNIMSVRDVNHAITVLLAVSLIVNIDIFIIWSPLNPDVVTSTFFSKKPVVQTLQYLKKKLGPLEVCLPQLIP